MAIRVFYSWQSDQHPKINRALIAKALNSAISRLNRRISPKDRRRLQLDHDTLQLPGSPDIVSAILSKIDDCDIFVADLTFVGTTTSRSSKKQKHLPNPNVMIEYGYALKHLTDKRIIAVMNETFGDRPDLPFNLAHKRASLVYRLSPNSSAKKIKATTRKLANDLYAEIGTIIRAEALYSKPKFVR